MNTAKVTLSAALLGMAVIGAPAQAADSGPYVAAAIGTSKHDGITGAGVGGSAATHSGTNGTGWKLAVGYQLNANFAIEFDYLDLDKWTGSTAGAIRDFDITGWGGSIVGALPLGQNFALTGKIGLLRWDQDATGNTPASDNGVNARWGFGARYNFTPQVALTAEWERMGTIGNTGSAVGVSQQNTLMTIGVRLKF